MIKLYIVKLKNKVKPEAFCRSLIIPVSNYEGVILLSQLLLWSRI